MRILHCLRAPVGGLFRHVVDLARAQAALGHDVGLIVDSMVSDPLTEQRLASSASHLSLGIARVAMTRLPSVCDVWAHRCITAHAGHLSLDVLHGHGAKGGAFARLAGRALKARKLPVTTFYTPHGGTLNYPPRSLEGRFFLGLEALLDPLTDGLIFESGFAAKTYNERLGTGTAPRRIVHNGLRPNDFEPIVLSKTATDFLYIGELRALKGVDVLLSALAQLNADRAVPVTATLVGAGPDAASLQHLAVQLGLGDVVWFAGAMHASTAFTLGRTLVVPSRKESFPYIVLEAAAAAKPLIATCVGGIPEILSGSDTPMIPADDVCALALAMADVTRDPELAQARALRLNQVVRAKFTVAQMTSEIVAFYAEAQMRAAQQRSPMSAAIPHQHA